MSGTDALLGARTADLVRPGGDPPAMGYQPALDGLRAVSVIAVLLYHAGFSWMHGGFFGVEVFFVVSGFLITSLLLDEQDRTGRVDFGNFWIRRVRRLFPALFAVIAAVAIWAVFAGTDEQVSQLRRDIPWAVFYAGNWGQILGDIPYFAGEPPLLRHLWSLAVEEQWYLFWPIVFVGLTALVRSRRALGVGVTAAAFGVMAFTFWLHSNSPTLLGGPPGLFEGLDRTNFLYLSTITRSSGLLLGAGAAFLWRPWRWPSASHAPVGRVLDPVGGAAVAGLGCAFAVTTLTDGYVYQWLLPVVTVLSLVSVLVAVHPAAVGFQGIMSWRPLVEVGKRSYGLYLWSWPIFVIAEATDGAVGRFLVAMAVTVVVSELSYRYLETPIRRGLIGRWWKDRAPITYAPIVGGGLLAASLIAFYASVEPFDRFVGDDDATFDVAAALDGSDGTASDGETGAALDGSDGTASDGETGAALDGDGAAVADGVASDGEAAIVSTTVSTSTTTTLPPVSSARLAIVGDSQANALAVNDPAGIEEIFPVIVNGSVDGCSVYDEGRILTQRSGFNNNFAFCDGWQDDWADAASGTDVTLVALGAWDVFDIATDARVYGFASADADELFVTNLGSGIDAVLAAGSNVGLLEVPCMRPISVEGAGVPPLPERGDDDRVAHVNELLREVADGYGPRVDFVEGPDEWCADESIADNTAYRWDGVHVYGQGAKLIYETVAGDLLDLAAV